MSNHTFLHTPHITDDLTPSFGENSWYLCKPLDECRSLLAEQASGYFAHAFKCKCGTQKIFVSKCKQHTPYSCKTCGNQQFLEETNYNNGYGVLLAKVDVPIDYEMNDTYATTTLSFLKPCGINMAKDSMEFMPEVVYTLDISLQTGEYTPKFHYLLCDDIALYAENTLVTYLYETYLKKRLKNYATYCTGAVDIATKKERLLFFLNHPHIRDAVQHRWYIPKDLHDVMKTHNSVEETLALLMEYRKERSVKRAFYERYVAQIKEGYFDTFSAYVICKSFKDPNFVCSLLSQRSFKFNSHRSDSFFYYADILINAIQVLIAYYGTKAIVALFLDDTYNPGYFDDVLLMIHLQEKDGILDTYFQKPRCNLMAIHDHLFHIENIREELLENKPFNYEKHYLNATGLWENDLEFLLPKESKTLCRWATTLNNCLCSYRDRVHNKQSFIFGIFKNNHLKYAIELDHQDRIIQASGQHNSEVPEKMSQNIHAWHKAYFKNKKT